MSKGSAKKRRKNTRRLAAISIGSTIFKEEVVLKDKRTPDYTINIGKEAEKRWEQRRLV